MPYPYSKVGGGLESVSWGDITGTLSEQTDLQAAIDAAVSTVSWGDITGTLSDQTDLQDELTRIENLIPEPELEWANYHNESFWEVVDGKYQWSSINTDWRRSTPADNNGDLAFLNLATGSTWAAGFRPTQMRLTLNSGPDSGGTPLAMEVDVTLTDEDDIVVADFDFVFSGWNEEQTITVDCTWWDYDMYALRISSYLENVGPYIKNIEFLAPL